MFLPLLTFPFPPPTFLPCRGAVLWWRGEWRWDGDEEPRRDTPQEGDEASSQASHEGEGNAPESQALLAEETHGNERVQENLGNEREEEPRSTRMMQLNGQVVKQRVSCEMLVQRPSSPSRSGDGTDSVIRQSMVGGAYSIMSKPQAPFPWVSDTRRGEAADDAATRS